MFSVESLEGWRDFKNRLANYLEKLPAERSKFYFRGHASCHWRLVPTIDRLNRRFESNDEREKYRDLGGASRAAAIRVGAE